MRINKKPMPWDGLRGPKVKYFKFSPTVASYKMIIIIVILKSCSFRNKNKNGSLG
jgi:hypothetical protein